MQNQTKYGLLKYDTENIGDEIQSIAAKRFLPHIDYYFNRDNIDSANTDNTTEIKLIMNGWYTHHPENWPPKNPAIKPLLVSMYVEQEALDGAAAKAFITQESKNFLKKFGPVGARSVATQNFLTSNDIESYFSGCLTLTINRDSRIKKQDFILAVDVSDQIYQAIRRYTTRTIYRLNTNHKKNLDEDTRILLAKFWLYLYQSAHAVITTRLHTMLPCLALNTPVFSIAGREPKRYDGLIDLTHHASEKDFLNNPGIFNFNHPPKNPTTYLKYRHSLEKTCSDFTGYDSKSSFLDNNTPDEIIKSPKVIQFFLDAAYDTWLTEEYSQQILNLTHSTNTNPTVSQPIGIKDSAKSLAYAIKRKLNLTS